MDNYKFKSLEELYQKLLPAFRVKVIELERQRVLHITEKDIWNYLKNNYWTKRSNLTLGDMVNDIFIVSEKELINNILKERN